MGMGGGGTGLEEQRGGAEWASPGTAGKLGAENPAGEVVGGRASCELRFPTLGTSSIVLPDSASKPQI